MLKQNDTITYLAQGYANSETVGYVEDTTVFVPFLIQGEQAQVKINYAKRGVAYGDAVKVLKPSACRVKPSCPHFGKCGGCSLMHMDYAEQLRFKTNKVANNFAKIAKMQIGVLPCQPSPKVVGYRNKLSLPVSGKAGNVKIGMYQKGSHNVVDMDACMLGGNWAVTVTKLFRAYLNERKIAPYNEKDFSGEVRHLVARYVDGQLLVTVVSNGVFKHDLSPFADMLARHFDKFGLFVNVNDYKNNVILGKTTHHVCGLQYISGNHCGVQFALRPNSFFQVNDGVKDIIYNKVKDLLDLSQTQVLVDCFSGIGILTNILASDRYDTFAIEIEPSAVADAQQMLQLNKAPRVTNVCGDVNVELPKLTQQYKDKVITLVVDPPRKGLGERICQTIMDANVNNVVYVSCDSATLARDVAMLLQKYAVKYLQPMDMFPNTAEVETICWLCKK